MRRRKWLLGKKEEKEKLLDEERENKCVVGRAFLKGILFLENQKERKCEVYGREERIG